MNSSSARIQLAAVLRRARDDQRRPRLVDQDTVHLVDDGEEMAALRHLLEGALHVVAQIVEAQLVIRRIGHVGADRRRAFRRRAGGIDHAGGHPQLGIDLAHPFRVALGQIVVDGDDMHALAGQRVQIGREGGDQGLALARLHLGDIALMQEDPAHQLHVEGAQAQRAARALAAVGKSLGQERVQAFLRPGRASAIRGSWR
jgi:hypothetical protein